MNSSAVAAYSAATPIRAAVKHVIGGLPSVRRRTFAIEREVCVGVKLSVTNAGLCRRPFRGGDP
jgi:hypothetical protein